MKFRSFKVLASILTLSMLVAPSMASGEIDPVVNGGFELQGVSTTGNGGYTENALYWSHVAGSNVRFRDFDSDGDREAIIAGDLSVSNHNMWQSTLPPLQTFSADFDAFEFTVEHGTISSTANVQIGLAFTPAYSQHPYAGIFWEGAVRFNGADLVADENGVVSLDPVAQGDIVCPAGWTPCHDFKAEFDTASSDDKHKLLGQTRVIQMSFWNFNRQAGYVVIDDVTVRGAKLIFEEAVESGVNVNPYDLTS